MTNIYLCNAICFAAGCWTGVLVCQRIVRRLETQARCWENSAYLLHQQLGSLEGLVRLQEQTLQLTAPKARHELWEPNQN